MAKKIATPETIVADEIQIIGFAVQTFPEENAAAQIQFALGYTGPDGKFVGVKHDVKVIRGQAFLDIVAQLPDNKLSIYDNLKNILYPLVEA